MDEFPRHKRAKPQRRIEKCEECEGGGVEERDKNGDYYTKFDDQAMR